VSMRVAVTCVLVALLVAAVGCGDDGGAVAPANVAEDAERTEQEKPWTPERQRRLAERIAAAHSPETVRAMRKHCRVTERPYQGGVGGFVSPRCARILRAAFEELPPRLQRLIREASEP
jgi:hypothetical protein